MSVDLVTISINTCETLDPHSLETAVKMKIINETQIKLNHFILVIKIIPNKMYVSLQLKK